MKELEVPSRAHHPVGTSKTRLPEFEMSKHIKLVPPFQEGEVDKYFLHFEKDCNKFRVAQSSADVVVAECVGG